MTYEQAVQKANAGYDVRRVGWNNPDRVMTSDSGKLVMELTTGRSSGLAPLTEHDKTCKDWTIHVDSQK